MYFTLIVPPSCLRDHRRFEDKLFSVMGPIQFMSEIIPDAGIFFRICVDMNTLDGELVAAKQIGQATNVVYVSMGQYHYIERLDTGFN